MLFFMAGKGLQITLNNCPEWSWMERERGGACIILSGFLLERLEMDLFPPIRCQSLPHLKLIKLLFPEIPDSVELDFSTR